MTAALALLIGGFTLAYSALKGQSLTEIFAGVTGDALDPKGGRGGTISGPGTNATGPNGPVTGAGDASTSGNLKKFNGESFKGPRAAYLTDITNIAISKYKLQVTDLCRPSNAGYGSSTSFHHSCRAVDLSGSPANMRAFALYVQKRGGYDELFYDPIGLIAPGFNHTDHVHVGG